MTTDPIADMLTRIRNGLSARGDSVSIPYSKIKASIAEILKTHGFIAGYEVSEGAIKSLTIQLAEQTTITAIQRVSKPGRRIYAGAKDIPTVLSGRGIIIISTSHGLMTGTEARQKSLGGELICKVY